MISPPTIPCTFDVATRQGLKSTGLTDAASDLLETSVQRFAEATVTRAILLAEPDQQAAFGLEVTTQHVKLAVDKLAGPISKRAKPKWYVPVITAEYVLALVAGAGAGHLDKPLGIGALLLSGLAAIALLTIRHIYVERDS